MTPWLVADGLRSMLDDEEASEDGAWLLALGTVDMSRDGKTAVLMVEHVETGKKYKLTVEELPSA
jgi:hypothetical protein